VRAALGDEDGPPTVDMAPAGADADADAAAAHSRELGALPLPWVDSVSHALAHCEGRYLLVVVNYSPEFAHGWLSLRPPVRGAALEAYGVRLYRGQPRWVLRGQGPGAALMPPGSAGGADDGAAAAALYPDPPDVSEYATLFGFNTRLVLRDLLSDATYERVGGAFVAASDPAAAAEATARDHAAGLTAAAAALEGLGGGLGGSVGASALGIGGYRPSVGLVAAATAGAAAAGADGRLPPDDSSGPVSEPEAAALSRGVWFGLQPWQAHVFELSAHPPADGADPVPALWAGDPTSVSLGW
jgi:hypothetical protein